MDNEIRMKLRANGSKKEFGSITHVINRASVLQEFLIPYNKKYKFL